MREETTQAQRTCLGGCVVGLFLLYPTWLLANIVIPLTLGFLFPWGPPVAQDAPSEAVLRVIVPEGETYRIEWGKGFGKKIEEGTVEDLEAGYQDHAVPEEAMNNKSDIDATVYVGIGEHNNQSGNSDLSVGAVLFVSGKYATCKGGSGRIYVRWDSHEELDSIIDRIICGSHRFAKL